MSNESLPIALFIESQYANKKIQKVVESWRIEPAVIITKLIEHFREMGIFHVLAGHESLMLQNILFQLRHSADIQGLVQKAKIDELKRQRSRHAE